MKKKFQRFIGLFMTMVMLFGIPNTAAAITVLPTGEVADFEFIGYNSDDFPFAFDILEYSDGMVTLSATLKTNELSFDDITILQKDENIPPSDRIVSITDGIFSIFIDADYRFSAYYIENHELIDYSCAISVTLYNNGDQDHLKINVAVDEGINYAHQTTGIAIMLDDAYVTFNGNGGGTAPARIGNYVGGYITLPGVGVLAKSGSSFVGWSTTNAPGTATHIYGSYTSYQVWYDHILYAAWQLQPTISYPSYNGQQIPVGNLTVTWPSVSGASYDISLRDLTTNTLLFSNRPVSGTSYTINQSSFVVGHEYRVAVQARIGSRPAGSWSERTFVTVANKYNVTNNVSNATISNTGTNAATHNVAWSGTLTANSGFSRPASITMTRSGANFTNFTYNQSTGVISIAAAQVTGPFIIIGTAATNRYDVLSNVPNATISNTGTNAATHNVAWSGTLTANSGFSRPASITMTRSGVNFTNFTYNQSTGVISIAAAQVTGQFMISGVAETIRYDVLNNVSNATISNTGTNAATHGTDWKGTLTADPGFMRPASITMTRSGVNFINYTYIQSTGAISFAATQVTGPFIISGAAVATFIPVTGITGVPTATTVGVPLALIGTVNPSNATSSTIIWSIVNAGTTGATIAPGTNTLYTAAAGTVTIMATIINGVAIGTNYTQTFNIRVTTTSGPPTITLQHNLFKIVGNDNAVAFYKNSGIIPVATVTSNVPARYRWELRNPADGSLVSPPSGDLDLHPGNLISVTAPSGAGKYNLVLIFKDGNGGEISRETYTAYVTHGAVLANANNFNEGVNKDWLDKALSRVNISTDETFAALNRAVYDAGAEYLEGQYINGAEYSTATKIGKIEKASCKDMTAFLCYLAKLVGIQGSTDERISPNSLNWGLGGTAIMMTPNVRAFDSTMNWWNKTGENVAGTLNERGAWVFGSHIIAAYNNSYYDPTLGLSAGNSKTGNVYAVLWNEGYDKGHEKYTYKMLTKPNPKSIEFRIEAETYPFIELEDGDNVSTSFTPLRYFYVPIKSTSAVAASETKYLAMPYDSPWTAVSNDSWIHVSETTISDNMQAMSFSNPDAIIVNTDPNTSSQMRTGTITVTTAKGTDTIYIYQDGINSEIEVSKPVIMASSSGKEDSIAITSNVNWVVLSDADWIELEYSFGVGDDELPVHIAENDTSEERTATITIAGEGIQKTVTVVQSASETLPLAIVTADAENIESSSATINGSFSNNTEMVEYGFHWGETDDPSTKVIIGTTDMSSLSFAFNLEGLDPDTVYYFKAYAGEVEGEVLSFKTSHVGLIALEMELIIGSDWLEGYEVEIDHDLQEGYCYIVLGSTVNVIFTPNVFKISEDGERVNVSDEIKEIKYFLNGLEYDTLFVGNPGEFDYWDLSWSLEPITITVELNDGTVLSYMFTYDISVVRPRPI